MSERSGRSGTDRGTGPAPGEGAAARGGAALGALRSRVTGRVLVPGEAGYDEARTGYQTLAPHRPAVLVAAACAADVRAAVEYAAAHRLPVAVQATGHAPAATAAGCVLITTGSMSGVRVDPAARTAYIEAGARGRQVVAAAAAHGLAPLSGSAPGVGAVAYTLGGGVGLLARRYGFAADHVRAVDLVTPAGEARRVTPLSDPDLFWAVRGGRDNFGVVTGLETALFPVTRLYGGGMYFPGERAAEILSAYRDWTASVPDDMTSSLALVALPPVPALPEPIRGKYIVHVRIAYAGDAGSGERLVAPLRALGPRLIDSVGELPYTDSWLIHNDPPNPAAYVATNVLLREFGADTAGRVLELLGPDAPVTAVVEVRHLGGALSAAPAVPSAVGHRDAAYLLGVLSHVPDGADPAPLRAAHQRLLAALEPLTVGRNLNFLFGADPETVRAAYDPDDYRRLRALKARYDPDNRFRGNLNIPPARG